MSGSDSMHCEAAREFIEKLVDGEASTEERSLALAHLEGCESCQEHAGFVRSLPVAVDQHPLEQPPESYFEALPQKILARIDRVNEEKKRTAGSDRVTPFPSETRKRRAGPQAPFWLASAAAVVLAIVLGRQVFQMSEAPESSPAISAEAVIAESHDSPSAVVGASEPSSPEGGATDTSTRTSPPADVDPALPSPSADTEVSQDPAPQPATASTPPASPPAPPRRAQAAPPAEPEPAAANVSQAPVESATTGVSVLAGEASGELRDPSAVEADTLDSEDVEDVEILDEPPRRRVTSARLGADAQRLARGGRSREPNVDESGAEAWRAPEEDSVAVASDLGVAGLASGVGSSELSEGRLRQRARGLAAGESSSIEQREALCRDWDRLGEQSVDTSRHGNVLYEAVMCHQELFETEGGESYRQGLIDAVERYLERDGGSERADALRRLIEGLQ